MSGDDKLPKSPTRKSRSSRHDVHERRKSPRSTKGSRKVRSRDENEGVERSHDSSRRRDKERSKDKDKERSKDKSSSRCESPDEHRGSLRRTKSAEGSPVHRASLRKSKTAGSRRGSMMSERRPRSKSPKEGRKERSSRSKSPKERNSSDRRERGISPHSPSNNTSGDDHQRRSPRKEKGRKARSASPDLFQSHKEEEYDDRSPSPTPSAVSRRRDRASQRGSSLGDSLMHISPQKEKRGGLELPQGLEMETPSGRRRSLLQLQTPSRRGQFLSSEDVANSSRTRATQRAQARENWRENHVKAKGKKDKDGGIDNLLDKRIEDADSTERRQSILDASRKGPIRAISRQRGAEGDDEYDDDDDDCSVVSSASYFDTDVESTINPMRRASCSYLPTGLSGGSALNDLVGKRPERRPSAFGSSKDRAHAIYNYNAESDSDDEDGYGLPGGSMLDAIKAPGKGGAQQGNNVKATTLVMPDISGGDNNKSSSGGLGKKLFGRKNGSRRASLMPGTETSRHDTKKGGERSHKGNADNAGNVAASSHDKALDDVLKNRRLRGTGGGRRDSLNNTTKKKDDEGKSKDPLKMLGSLVAQPFETKRAKQ